MIERTLEPAIYASSVLFLILCSFITYFVVIYRKKQAELERERLLFQAQLKSAEFQSQLEIVEQTLQSLALEIHDGVGQRLTLTLMYINQMLCSDSELKSTCADLLESTLTDLRNICKNMNGNYVLERGIENALEREAQLLSKGKVIECGFKTSGIIQLLNDQQEIILFRCAQEAINNAIKHAKANKISIGLMQNESHTILEIKDDGAGFDSSNIEKGLGLNNMQNRMHLLNGNFELNSAIGLGTKLKFSVPNQPKLN
jgi:signal transduction histidine kinase